MKNKLFYKIYHPSKLERILKLFGGDYTAGFSAALAENPDSDLEALIKRAHELTHHPDGWGNEGFIPIHSVEWEEESYYWGEEESCWQYAGTLTCVRGILPDGWKPVWVYFSHSGRSKILVCRDEKGEWFAALLMDDMSSIPDRLI